MRMTWLLWIGLLVGLLAGLAVGLSAYGGQRWNAATQALQGRLEASRIDRRHNPGTPPTR